MSDVGNRHVMLVLSSASPGRLDEFQRWYDDHLRRMGELEHVVSCRRLARVDGHGHPCDHEFLTIYELAAETLDQAVAEVAAARVTMPDNPAFAAPPVVWFFSACVQHVQQARSYP